MWAISLPTWCEDSQGSPALAYWSSSLAPSKEFLTIFRGRTSGLQCCIPVLVNVNEWPQGICCPQQACNMYHLSPSTFRCSLGCALTWHFLGLETQVSIHVAGHVLGRGEGFKARGAQRKPSQGLLFLSNTQRKPRPSVISCQRLPTSCSLSSHCMLSSGTKREHE